MFKRILVFILLGGAFSLAASAASTERNAVHFGSNIHVPAGTAVHDAVCFFCSVNAEGDVKGNLVVFFGSIHLAGAAHHDVVNFFGSLQAEDRASIGHNLVSFFGGMRLGDGVTVGHDMVAMFGHVESSDTLIVEHNRVIQPFWIAGVPVLVIFLVVIVLVHELRNHRRRQILGNYPFPPR